MSNTYYTSNSDKYNNEKSSSLQSKKIRINPKEINARHDKTKTITKNDTNRILHIIFLQLILPTTSLNFHHQIPPLFIIKQNQQIENDSQIE